MDRLKHILSSKQFDLGFLVNLYKDTRTIERLLKTNEGEELLLNVLPGKRIGAFFWQESSRTLESFNAAGGGLGAFVFNERGSKVSKKDENGNDYMDWELIFSSAAKKAKLSDEFLAWAFSHHALVLRTHRNGMPEKAAQVIDLYMPRFGRHVPVINAGDRTNEHPTQALLDLYTILQAFNLDIEKDWERLKNYSIAFVGDPIGRAVRSLAFLAGGLLKMELKFIAPQGLKMSEVLRQELTQLEVQFSEHTIFQPADIYYVLRLQDEYASAHSNKLKELTSYYSVTKLIADQNKVKAVMHPFPRSEEYNELPAAEDSDLSLDMDERNFYFQQMANGVPVRMALLKYLLKPGLELNKLDEMQIERSYNTQCLSCLRIWSPILKWSRVPYPKRVETYSKIPFCPDCEYDKSV